MGDKYLATDASNGGLKEVASTDTGGTGAQAGKIPALDGNGRFPLGMMPVGLGADTVDLTAVTALSAGDVVSIVATGAQRASAAASGTDVDGFVLTASAQGATATVYLEGRNTACTGLTAGSRYFLSASTPGAVTATPPTGTGVKLQYVGKAISATSLAFEPDLPITLA